MLSWTFGFGSFTRQWDRSGRQVSLQFNLAPASWTMCATWKLISAGATDAELANIVSLFVANIACLNDHLKAWCKAHNKPFHGDKLIDCNRDVGIIHDLWNRDKHFDLKRSRTGLFPEIRNISRSARLSTQAQAGSSVAMTLALRTGQLRTHGDGKVELVVDADVVDSTGARLGGFIEIAERAITEWETALVTAGVAVAPR